jgi:hypothetical protein
MTKFTGIALLLIGAAGSAFGANVQVPEIDPATGVAALALLSGAILVIRARRRK